MCVHSWYTTLYIHVTGVISNDVRIVCHDTVYIAAVAIIIADISLFLDLWVILGCLLDLGKNLVGITTSGDVNGECYYFT